MADFDFLSLKGGSGAAQPQADPISRVDAKFRAQKTYLEGTFRAQDLLRPHAIAAPVESQPVGPVRAPQFLTPKNFFRHGWWGMLRVALSRYPLHAMNASSRLFRQIPVLPRRFIYRSLASSIVLHVIVLFCVPFLWRWIPASVDSSTQTSVDNTVVYYRIPLNSRLQPLPKLLPPGPGSMPGSGKTPSEIPLKGATASHSLLYAVSKPRVHDNTHQTILQSQTPPDLRLKTDIKIPNLFIGKAPALKAPIPFDSKNLRPLDQAKRTVNADAPNLKAVNPTDQLSTLLTPTDHQPRLAVPVGAAPAPRVRSQDSGGQSDGAAPEFSAPGTSNQTIIALGTDPGNPADAVALPPGNRYGQFSIAPGGQEGGSPGGFATGSETGGSGGAGAAGNESVGVGSGSYGGGGGKSGAPGILSLKGSAGGASVLSDPDPGPVESMVFALPKLSGPRRNGLMIAAGPMGGGGLGVYGALHCGKIYTVLIPMAGKNWTLQFCQTPIPGARPVESSRSAVVHMESTILAPEAETRFDFKRLPLPPEKAHKLIILKGTISPEGAVTGVNLFEGLLPAMDAAAVRAFSQWKFKPAIRDGSPISVDILVGIPSDGREGLGGLKAKGEITPQN